MCLATAVARVKVSPNERLRFPHLFSVAKGYRALYSRSLRALDEGAVGRQRVASAGKTTHRRGIYAPTSHHSREEPPAVLWPTRLRPMDGTMGRPMLDSSPRDARRQHVATSSSR